MALVQGPAHAFVAARGNTAPTRAAVIPGLDIRSTPLLEVRIIASNPHPCTVEVQARRRADRKDCHGRDIQREDARSLSSGRALRGPVGAFGPAMTGNASA